MKYFFPIFFLIFAGCAQKVRISAKKLKGQSLLYVSGQEVVTSKTKNSIANLSCGPSTLKTSDRFYCFLVIKNTGKKPINISTEDIEVKVHKNNLNAISYDQLKQEIDDAVSGQRLSAALNLASQNMNASQAGYSQTTTSGSLSNQYGNQYNYSATSNTYDQSKVDNYKANANKQYADTVNSASNYQDVAYKSLRGYLRRTTIFPGKEENFTFRISKLDSLPKTLRINETPLRIKITIEDEIHPFLIKKKLHALN